MTAHASGGSSLEWHRILRTAFSLIHAMLTNAERCLPGRVFAMAQLCMVACRCFAQAGIVRRELKKSIEVWIEMVTLLVPATKMMTTATETVPVTATATMMTATARTRTAAMRIHLRVQDSNLGAEINMLNTLEAASWLACARLAGGTATDALTLLFIRL